MVERSAENCEHFSGDISETCIVTEDNNGTEGTHTHRWSTWEGKWCENSCHSYRPKRFKNKQIGIGGNDDRKS